MDILEKSFPAGLSAAETERELAAVNAFTRREMSAGEVYVFAVKLCDNDIDRDGERFSDECLAQLAGMFVGKTGIMDHDWSAQAQLARIYRAEVAAEPGRKNACGGQYRYLKGWAYMPRGGKNDELIAAVDAGIIREVSIGCAVARRTCSVCGAAAGQCGHVPGREYGGAVCHTVLSEATDVYEWSFVAVPAQREAGVMKRAGRGDLSLDALVKSGGGRCRAEYEALCARADAGDRLTEALRAEVRRLGLLWDEELAGAVCAAGEAMDAAGLLKLRAGLEKKLAGRFPPLCQLPGENRQTRFDGDEYKI